MSLTRIPNSGPLGSDYLDELRVSALMALDEAPEGTVPADLLTYIVGLERNYLDRRHQQSRQSLDSLWAPRRSKFTAADDSA